MVPNGQPPPGGDRERALQAVLDHLPALIYAVDAENRITLTNRAVEQLLGINREALAGRRREEVFAPADAAEHEANDQLAIASGAPIQVVEHLQCDAGPRRYLAVKAPLRDSDGNPIGVAAVATDVTELAATHEHLQMSETHHRLLFERNPQPMWVYDTQTLRFLAVNEAAISCYGYSREEFLAMGLEQIRPAEDVPRLRDNVRVQQDGLSHSGDWRHLTRDGRILEVAIQSSSLLWEGKPARLVVATDVTARNCATAELDGFFSVTPGLRSILNRDGRFLRLNARWSETLGYSPRDLEGRRLSEFVHASDRILAETAIESLAAGNDVPPFAVRIRCTEGRYSMLEWHAKAAGERIYCVAHDVTQRNEMEGRLRDLSQAVEQSPASVVITDCEGRIEYVNRKFQEVTGYSSEEVIGRTPRILKSGQTLPEAYDTMWKTIKSGQIWEGEFHNRKKDGSIYTERASISPIVDRSGTIQHFVAVKEDITQQRYLERQLQESQKLEAIGLLAGGVAHDFNNLLTIINGYSELLEADPRASETMLAHIAAIRQAGDQASKLTRQLLLFGRQQVGEPTVIDLAAAVDNLRQFYKRVMPGNIALKVETAEHPALVVADPSQMEQIVMNLVVNARDAMPDGGQLSICCETVMLTGDPAEHAPASEVGPYVRLSVMDTGEGMTEETRNRIFEPFFTTKPTGRGTGLGLSIVYGIVKQARGWIHVESEPSVGTAVRVYIPSANTGASAQPKVPPVHLERFGAEETILLVEDYDEVRDFTASLLTNLGYNVISAASGEEALEIARAKRGAIDVLVTDMMLPGMSGAGAAQRIQAEFPVIKVLFISGYVASIPEMNESLSAGAAFLAKPFSASQLQQRVQDLLRRSNENRRILVVDDDPGIRELFRGVLEDSGYQVALAPDGEAALRHMILEGADLILMDLAMPGMEGLETLRELRSRGNTVPLVAISGAFGEGLLSAARMMGANATLPKPVTRCDLLRTVRDVLRVCTNTRFSRKQPGGGAL